MARLTYAIVFVSEMGRSVAFYRDVLELPLKFQSPHWTEFATDAVTLALHHAERADKGAETSTVAKAGSCQVGLTVTDLDAFHQALVARGVVCIQPPRLEDFGGKLAKYADPDGLPFTVSEGSIS
jgi:lactoylglutathione lyase